MLHWSLLGAIERTAALILLLAVTPLLAVAALVIWHSSGRPPFVGHLHIGRYGIPFWVIKLKMSLVGPRAPTEPELRSEYGVLAKDVLSLRPGITGLWQILGRSRLRYAQRRMLNVFYARRQTPKLNLTILARTVPQVLTVKDAW